MRYEHIQDVDVTARFSEENGLNYRYRLDILLKDSPPSGKTACAIMQNPSYASEDVADRSVQFMEKLVFQKDLPEFAGVRRLIVVNQFARVQTRHFRGLRSDIGADNDSAIKDAFRRSSIIIIAWGAANAFEERKAFVFGLLKKMKGKRLFKTASHPSRGRFEGFIQPLNM